MNRNFTRWGLSQLVAIFMLVIAGSAFAAPGDQLTHNSNNLGTKYGVWGTVGGKYGEITCATCHNSTTTNVKRVKQTITATLGSWSSSKTPGVPVVFNNMTAFGTDAAAHTTTSTAVCQVCHSKTTVHRYNKPAGQTDLNHQNSNQADCTQCHSHAKAFAASCNGCHGYPPTSATPGPNGLALPATGALAGGQAGAHGAHDGIGMKCDACHVNHTVLNHGTPGSKVIELQFKVNKANWAQFSNYSVKTGTYTGQLNANLTNGYTWSAGVTQSAGGASCNIYCHGAWTGSNGATPPSWIGGPAEKACGACHGASAATTPTTAAHARHAGNGVGGLSITCDKCHGAHPDNSHVTGSVKWAFTGLSTTLSGSPQYKGARSGETGIIAPSASFGNCSNLYCHSNVQNVNTGSGKPTSYASLTWAVATINCGSCHMGQGAGFSLISSGSHRAHVSRGYTYNCNACHNLAGDQQANHADGNIQVTFAAPYTGTYSQAGQPAGNGYGTCSSTNCHSTIVPTWGTPLAASCVGCHGTEVSNAANLTPLHDKHMNFPQFGGNFKCNACHAQVITNADNRTIADKTKHADTVKNYSGAMAGKTLACNNFYCHSNGKNTWVNPSTWAVATPMGCDGCHGLNNGTGAPLAGVLNNSHVKHAPTAADCWMCHQKTASKTAGQLVTGTVDHLDKTLDARLSKPFTFANTSGVYSGSRTCSTTYCHGTAATTAWGVVGINCNSCHKSKWNGSVGLPGAHKFHLSSSAAGATNYNFNGAANTSNVANYNYNCATCHATGGGKATHVNGPPTATSGAAEVFFGYTSSVKKGAYVFATVQGGTDNGFTFTNGAGCNTSYCHSNGQPVAGAGSNGLTDPNWATITGTGTCAQCHGNEGNATTLSGTHNDHITGTSGGTFKCNACHAQVITNADNRTLADKSKHVNKIMNYSGALAGKNKNCANIYCHSNGKNTFANPPVWTSTTDLGCNGCHGTGNAFGRPDNGTPNSHAAHAAAATDCVRCHRLSVTTAGTLLPGNVDHLDKTIDARLAKVNSFVTYSGVYNAGKTCSATYCHGGATTTTAWGSAPMACNSCHLSNSSLQGAHSLHVNATVPGAGSYTLAPANTSSLGVYNFTCASCHGNDASKHADGSVITNSDATIFFGFSTAGKNPVYARTGTPVTDGQGFKWMYGANAACNATYCHSNGRGGAGALATYTWNTITTGPCNSCHGNEANAGTLSGSHNKHVTSAMFGGATLMKCKDCHAPTITNIDNRTLANKAKHVDKFMDYSGRYAGKNKTCNNIYCHSNGKGSFNNPTWVGTNAVGCAFCHATSGLVTGSHNAHITSPNMAVGCKYCHNNTTNNDTSITGAQHIDGTVNIVAGTSLTYFPLVPKAVSFTPSGTTCNNISCHSAYTVISNTATWGATGTCETCHPKGNLSVGHLVHIGALDFTQSNNPAARIFYNMTANRSPNTNDTVKRHGFGCATCHPLTETNHLNGAVEIDLASKNVANTGNLRFLNSTTATKLPSINGSKQCMNIYCHSNASRVPAELTYTLTPAWGGSFGAGDRCAKCHLNQPKTGAHGAHAVGNHTFNNATSLAGSNMLDGNIFNGKTGKVLIANRKNTAHGNPDNSTTISCNICHKTTMNNPQNDQNYKCRQCHVSGSNGGLVKGNASISSLKSHVNGNREVTFDPIFVKSKAQVRPKGASANNSGFDFYSGVWKRNTYKNNSTLSYDTSKVRLDIATTYTLSTPQNSFCSNVVCHNGGSPKWNLTDYNDPNKCMDCHSKL